MVLFSAVQSQGVGVAIVGPHPLLPSSKRRSYLTHLGVVSNSICANPSLWKRVNEGDCNALASRLSIPLEIDNYSPKHQSVRNLCDRNGLLC